MPAGQRMGAGSHRQLRRASGGSGACSGGQCAGQGPSVLLVSGYGATMGDWGDLPTRLGATARTCMYDSGPGVVARRTGDASAGLEPGNAGG